MPLPDLDADTATFEEWRSLLFGVAYRMLGSATDAEDVVQEACIRWLRRGPPAVESVRAYLVTIVTRLCLDQLDSARAQRETYAGPWLPEPVAEDDIAAIERADSLSLAFLVLLEELTPLERATYLLHDVFGYSFDEVAVSLGRTPAACRQLGARARKHVDERRRRFDADLQHGRELTDRFVTACATGDLSGLLAMLSEDVVVWTDGGGKVRAAMRPVIGLAPRVALLDECGQESPGVASVGCLEWSAGDRFRRGRHRAVRVGAGHPGGPHRGRPRRQQPRQACSAERTPRSAVLVLVTRALAG